SAFADDPWQRARSPIASAYIVGLAVMLVRLWLRLSGGKSISGRSEAIENTDVLLALARAVKRMQFAYTPGIAYSARAAVPCVVGILKPMLILPFSAATSLTPEQLELVVMHELAHVRRYDHVVSLIQRLGESMLFFHPAVWYL